MNKVYVLRSLSGLMINFSAGWLGFAIIAPNFSNKSLTEIAFLLTESIFFGMLFLVFSIVLERRIEKINYER